MNQIYTPHIRRRSLLLGAALTPLLTALPSLGHATPQIPVKGGTLSFNVGQEPPVLISATNTGSAMYITGKIIEGLLTYDLDFNPVGQLAQSWHQSEDGLTYRFTLKEGVKWHDGEAFNAEDVKFSLLALKQEHPRARGTFANLETVTILSDYEIEVVFTKPAPYFLRALAAMEAPILPEHIFKGESLVSHEGLNTPIGTGPFRFVEWQRGSHVLLERNHDYHVAGLPHIDQLVIRFITDPAAVVTAVETGEIQVALGGIPVADIDRLSSNPDLVVEPKGARYNNAILRALFNLDRPALQDQRLRQAIAHAIDKSFIVNTIYLGNATALHGPVSSDVTEFYTDDVPKYEYDIAKANALLDEAGLQKGADGYRLSLFIDPMQSSGPHRQISDYLAQSLAQIGIKAEVRTQDFAGFVKRVYTDRDFDIAIEPMSNLFDPTVGVQRLYWSKNFKPGVPFSNGAHYENAEVDAVLEQAARENDPQLRRDLFKRFQQIVATDLPNIDLIVPFNHAVYAKGVKALTDRTLDGVSNSWADVWYEG